MSEDNNIKKELQEKLKLKELLDQFRSGDDKKMSKALKSLQIHGDETVILPIIDVWVKGISEKMEKEVMEFLSSLKASYACHTMMEAVEDPNFAKKRQQILHTIWNTKVDFSDYLSDFVKIACEGDFMDTLECLTIIENLEGPFEEEELMESQVHLAEYAEANPGSADQKAQLISELAIILRDIELNIEG